MKRGYWIILNGPGGELDRKFEPLDGDLQEAVRLAVSEWTLDAGDTIAIVEGQSGPGNPLGREG